MLNSKINFYKFFNNLNFYFNFCNFCIFIKGPNGLIMIKVPLNFFYKNLQFLFLTYFKYISFLRLISMSYSKLYYYHFFFLKLKGLGFRVRKIVNLLYKFFFTSTIFIIYMYLHVY